MEVRKKPSCNNMIFSLKKLDKRRKPNSRKRSFLLENGNL